MQCLDKYKHHHLSIAFIVLRPACNTSYFTTKEYDKSNKVSILFDYQLKNTNDEIINLQHFLNEIQKPILC